MDATRSVAGAAGGVTRDGEGWGTTLHCTPRPAPDADALVAEDWLQWVIAAVCLSLVSILGVTFYLAAENMEAALVDQLIAEELDFLVERHRADGCLSVRQAVRQRRGSQARTFEKSVYPVLADLFLARAEPERRREPGEDRQHRVRPHREVHAVVERLWRGIGRDVVPPRRAGTMVVQRALGVVARRKRP